MIQDPKLTGGGVVAGSSATITKVACASKHAFSLPKEGRVNPDSGLVWVSCMAPTSNLTGFVEEELRAETSTANLIPSPIIHN